MEDLEVLKRRYAKIQKELDKIWPKVTTALNYKTPFQLLIATILSAQCTDTLVNKITKDLFVKYPNPKKLSQAKLARLKKEIYPITFYNNKAKAIIATAKIIEREYGGKVPKEMKKLIGLPGVARKTANVVLGHAYNLSAGLVVDTDVKRVARRLGLTKNTEPLKIESDLIRIVPNANWIKFADQLIWHGRKYCTARKDKCPEAGFNLIHYNN